jgi:predicted RecB family nuclease
VKFTDGQLRISATDLSDFLACRHLTRRSIQVARGSLRRPSQHDAGFDALVERGKRHEAAVLDRFRAEGWSDVIELDPFSGGLDAAETATHAAIARGADLIYQGVLTFGDEVGLPDFLVRADLLGSDRTGFEVIDAKLARSAKARAVLQTAFYTRLLGRVQGTEPVRMHLALGGKEELESFRVADFAAYERQVSRMLGEFALGDEDPYPDPVEHCAICRWRSACTKRRREDDYLSLVAGISARQRKVLFEHGVSTLEQLGDLDAPPTIEELGADALANTYAQARIQLRGRRSGKPEWEFREPERDEEGALEPNRGLLILPEPAYGDLFFDIEGARYYSEDGKTFGLQYLFGIVDTADHDDEGIPRYRQIWSFDRRGEKAGFEELIDYFTQQLESYPNMHVYHYNHYEPTSIDALSTLHDTMHEAVGTLMGRFATHEDEVDRLLTLGVFVDLYRVVRQGIRASVESYSIKRLEKHIGYVRQVALADVNERMVLFEGALEDGTAETDAGTREVIRGYNEDDCRATVALRDWLEARRADLQVRLEEPLPRPQRPEPPEDHSDPEILSLRERLLEGVPEDPAERTENQRGAALVADLLEWHRREDKPKWWHYFYLRGLSDDELVSDQDALAGLEYVEVVKKNPKSHDLRFSFPLQDHGIDEGRGAFDARAEDPFPPKVTVKELDEDHGHVVLRLGHTAEHPTALLPDPTVAAFEHRRRLKELGEAATTFGGLAWPHSAAIDLLLRRAPNVSGTTGTPLLRDGEETVDAGIRLALELQDSCLPVQGPPGSGKTYLGARLVLALVDAGRKVGVTATSHSVIDNLLAEVVRVADAKGRPRPAIGQRVDPDYEHVHANAVARGEVYGSPGKAIAALGDDEISVLGGTTWLWANDHAGGRVDTLIADEASQLSLANVLAAAASCRNLILLGDPLQLSQPSQAAHPPDAGVSALEHILGEDAVIPDHLGLFIPKTRRMHPKLCAFTSEVFYDGKLESLAGLERQAITGTGDFAGAGLRQTTVVHQGNASASPEEAARIVEITKDLLGRQWLDREGASQRMNPTSILVVTPFNAQIRVIEDALEAAKIWGVLVGTVDKFQGREAPVTIYSMASSSAEIAPRGMEFLYQLNRLNVATSRARCISVIVSTPDLARVLCKTPRQMRLANALCWAEEYASQ